jgi:hypothetical protein
VYLQLPSAQALQQQQQQRQQGPSLLQLWNMIRIASSVQQGQQLGLVGWQGA